MQGYGQAIELIESFGFQAKPEYHRVFQHPKFPGYLYTEGNNVYWRFYDDGSTQIEFHTPDDLLNTLVLWVEKPGLQKSVVKLLEEASKGPLVSLPDKVEYLQVQINPEAIEAAKEIAGYSDWYDNEHPVYAANSRLVANELLRIASLTGEKS